jgi:hypothetical protein
MARLISTSERLIRARKLIQEAREVQVPEITGRFDLAYIAQVKGLLQQARDLIKFLPNIPSTSSETKEEVKKIYQEADLANQEILHPK